MTMPDMLQLIRPLLEKDPGEPQLWIPVDKAKKKAVHKVIIAVL